MSPTRRAHQIPVDVSLCTARRTQIRSGKAPSQPRPNCRLPLIPAPLELPRSVLSCAPFAEGHSPFLQTRPALALQHIVALGQQGTKWSSLAVADKLGDSVGSGLKVTAVRAMPPQATCEPDTPTEPDDGSGGTAQPSGAMQHSRASDGIIPSRMLSAGTRLVPHQPVARALAAHSAFEWCHREARMCQDLGD